jgi:hypothetical protein
MEGGQGNYRTLLLSRDFPRVCGEALNSNPRGWGVYDFRNFEQV